MKYCKVCNKPIPNGPYSFYCDACEPPLAPGSCDACGKQLTQDEWAFCTWCLENPELRRELFGV
jgi:predicted amidophosphoribosyltransferase